MQSPIIQVDNLQISFRTYAGKVHAIRGIDLDLYPGAVSYTHLTLPTKA